MTVPKYIKEIMERAKFRTCGDYMPGYTIDIAKRTHYEYASTFREEINRLVKWVNREYKKMSGDNETIAFINFVPEKTEYKAMQHATVTIYDPIMRYIEKYIKQ